MEARTQSGWIRLSAADWQLRHRLPPLRHLSTHAPQMVAALSGRGRYRPGDPQFPTAPLARTQGVPAGESLILELRCGRRLDIERLRQRARPRARAQAGARHHPQGPGPPRRALPEAATATARAYPSAIAGLFPAIAARSSSPARPLNSYVTRHIEFRPLRPRLAAPERQEPAPDPSGGSSGRSGPRWRSSGRPSSRRSDPVRSARRCEPSAKIPLGETVWNTCGPPRSASAPTTTTGTPPLRACDDDPGSTRQLRRQHCRTHHAPDPSDAVASVSDNQLLRLVQNGRTMHLLLDVRATHQPAMVIWRLGAGEQ